ncbi:MAG TPA: hypothetical protein VI837_02530 [Blastocatellia bacterium]|nr:hypothetical protein [Blastocatellia bacterium]
MTVDEADELQRERLRAEIDKLHAETVVARRQRWTALTEWVKVTGAIAATLFALYAASTTYRIMQLETRVALADKKEADEIRTAAITARDAAVAAKNKSERELAALLIQVQTAQDTLSKLESRSSTPALSESLKSVGRDLQKASETAEQVLPYVLVVPALSAQNADAAAFADLLRQQGVRSGVNDPLRKPENAPSVLV